MSKFECGSVARFAAAAGLGLTLVLGAAPVVAMADEVVSAAGSQESTQNATSGDEGVVPVSGGVAEVNGNSYESLAGAIAAAPDGVQTTVTLVGDIVMKTEDIVTIPAKKNIVLDMARHKITPSDDFTGRPIVNYGMLTVTGNGTIDVSSAPSGYGSLDNYGIMTVKNGTFRGNLNANGANVWNRSGAIATFNGGRFDTSRIAVATEVDSTTHINGGYFESPWYPALENNGNAYLTGGEFVNTSCSTCDTEHWGYTVRSGLKSKDAYLRIDDATVTGTQGGVAVVGGTSEIYGGIFRTVDCAESHGAVFYALYVAGESYKTAATVYGGTFSSEKRVAVLVGNSQGDGGNEEEATLVINGGSFSGGGEGKTALAVDRVLGGIAISEGTFSSPVPESYCADGFKPITTPNADGQYVVAKSKDVVKVGDQAYDSIQAALDSVKDSDEKAITLTLEADVYENVTIPDGYDVTLDLGGFTLTNDTSDPKALSHTITNNGTLTIVDSSGAKTGTVDNVSHAKGALVNEGVVTIESGTLTRSQEAGSNPDNSGGNSWYVVDNQGKMTFTGGSVKSKGMFSSLIRNLDGTLNVRGGSFENGFIAIKNDDGGTLNISGGTISSDEQSVQNWSDAAITGGTLTGDVISWSYLPDNPAVMNISGGEILGDIYSVSYSDSARSQVSITGGSITGQVASASYSNGVVIDQATNASSDLSVSGGTFEELPIDYVTKDRVVKINDDGTFTALERKDLPVGTYMVPAGAEKLTAEDFEPGLSITVDENKNVIATKPYVPPVVTGDAVMVEQSDGGTVKVSPTRADEGDEVTVTVTPDEGQEVREVTVTDEDGESVTVEAGEKDGEFVFTMPDGAVTVTVTFGCDGGELCPTHSFTDVDQDAWYHDAVDWAVEGGLMSGYGHVAAFGVSDDLSRAQLAKVLWNAAGQPEADPAGAERFSDCSADDWFAEALSWAASEGIISGYDDGTFGPADPVTREQLATMLWRRAGSPEADAELGFADADEVSSFAREAVEWAVSEGVLSGYEDGSNELGPIDFLERCQCALMFMRLAAE